ncbi:hypothetical protein RIVM261_067980 [Rivularia sp. IAM M-261]|nr:hypothetical protein RIVM261_067980 [Rivularia sp. IAM M-261]
MRRKKNTPAFYSEMKKGHEIFLTDTVWNELKAKSKEKNLSVSEYVERWVRESLTLKPSQTEEV